MNTPDPNVIFPVENIQDVLLHSSDLSSVKETLKSMVFAEEEK